MGADRRKYGGRRVHSASSKPATIHRVRWQIKLTSSVSDAVAAAVVDIEGGKEEHKGSSAMDARLVGTLDLMVNIAITVVRSPFREVNSIGGPPLSLSSTQTRQSSVVEPQVPRSSMASTTPCKYSSPHSSAISALTIEFVLLLSEPPRC
jgi:hypothetical protein